MQSNILARRYDLSLFSRVLTPEQLLADQAFKLSQQALSDPIALTAMGLAPVFGKLGRLAFQGGTEKFFASFQTAWLQFTQRSLSRAAGFGAEIFTFEGVQRGLRVGVEGAPRFLLEWKNFKDGLLHSAINIGLLKGAGLATARTNLVFNHFATDAAMVAGNQLAARFGMIETPRESLLHQWIQAHAMNWQMKAGLAVFHRTFPGLAIQEKALEVSWEGRRTSPRPFSLQQLSVMSAEEAPAGERRHLEFREKITEHLDRFATYLGENPQALKKVPSLTLFALHGKVAKIEGRIFPKEEIFDFEKGDQIYRAASQLQRVLEAWQPRSSLQATVEMLSLIEESLDGKIGSLFVEREVRRFVSAQAPMVAKVKPARKKAAQAPEPSGSANDPKPYELRDYQKEMLDKIYEDAVNEVSPWLGLASPMQTGKSYLAGPVIQRLRAAYGPQARFIVLTSTKVITRQVVDDLLEGFPAQEVGVYDAKQKQIRPITVASVHTLIRHLSEFSQEGPTILINDEAYSTQSPMFRSIYTHFVLAEVVTEGGREILKPKGGNGLVVGLSGTGAGLEGYHVSGRLNITDAIKAGWIRHMRGDRVILSIPSERKESVEERDMIWWKATEENAEALADIYDEKIFGQYHRVSIYVPTIPHAELLRDALRKRHGNEHAFAVHSDMENRAEAGSLDQNFERVIEHWERNGGAVISIGQLSRGYRGKGIDAAFHTYQSASMELFGQRTGRGWAGIPGETLPDYYVLEVAWDAKARYANLAVLLGLVNYPPRPFSSRDVESHLKRHTGKKTERADIEGAIRDKKTIPIFTKIPLLTDWRNDFARVLDAQGGINALAEKTGLSVEELTGYALGALPVYPTSVKALEPYLGEQARERWATHWKEAAAEIREGLESFDDRFTRDLLAWTEDAATESALENMLQKYFPAPQSKPANKKLQGIDALKSEFRGSRELRDLENSELEALIEQSRLELRFSLDVSMASDRMKWAILERRIFAPQAESIESLVREFSVHRGTIVSNEVNLKVELRRLALKIHERAQFGAIHLSMEFASSNYPILDFKIKNVGFGVQALNGLESIGIVTLRDLIIRSEAELLTIKHFGRISLREVKEILASFGLALRGSPVSPGGLVAIAATFREGVESANALLDLPVSAMHLSLKTSNNLARLNIHLVGDLVRRREEDLLASGKIGPLSIQELKRWMSVRGLHFGMELPNWRVLERDVTEQLLNLELSNLSLSVRTENCMQNAGIATVRDLTQKTEQDLLKIKNFGRRNLKEIKDRLASMGLGLKGNVEITPVTRLPDEIITLLGKSAETSDPRIETLNIELDELTLSVRAAHCLENLNIRYIGELVQKTEAELLKTKNFGRKTIMELTKLLAEYNLHFGMSFPEWTPPSTSEE